jgi:hypothetical protein
VYLCQSLALKPAITALAVLRMQRRVLAPLAIYLVRENHHALPSQFIYNL